MSSPCDLAMKSVSFRFAYSGVGTTVYLTAIVKASFLADVSSKNTILSQTLPSMQ